MKIYVASSWRNLVQPGIVHALRRCAGKRGYVVAFEDIEPDLMFREATIIGSMAELFDAFGAIRNFTEASAKNHAECLTKAEAMAMGELIVGMRAELAAVTERAQRAEAALAELSKCSSCGGCGRQAGEHSPTQDPCDDCGGTGSYAAAALAGRLP